VTVITRRGAGQVLDRAVGSQVVAAFGLMILGQKSKLMPLNDL
jgi:hypothetical protein